MSESGEKGTGGHGDGSHGVGNQGPGGGNDGPGGGPGHREKIEVIVNEKTVILDGENQTGLSIKEAAIKQGVGIKLDFVLSIEKGGGKTELIGDSQPIKVHKRDRFLAIPNDDNS